MASDHDAELARFLAGEPVAIDRTLQTLPRSADLARAVEVVLRMIDQPHWLAACGQLPAPLVRAVLGATATRPFHIFLQLAVSPDAKAPALKKAWGAAVDALHQLADTTHSLESPERRTQLAAIAEAPAQLQAIQGVAANTTNETLPVEMLVVLAIDGSDASLDALIPHIDLALGSRDARLERLALLRPFVRPTPALAALFAELDAAVQARRSTSPALAFAAAIGLGELPQFWFSLMLTSVDRNKQLTVPRVQGSLRVDSREDPWFAVELCRLADSHDRSGDRSSRFDDTGAVDDGLGIGRCDPLELPAWLAATRKKLKMKWAPFFVRSNVDKPDAIKNWLLGI